MRTNNVTSAATIETEETPAPVELSAAARRSIEKVRTTFKAFTDGFTLLAGKREELAPKFMKAFATYREAAGPESTFIDFVRFLEPSVPVDRSGRDGYKAHKAYQAADYLRRLDASLRQAQEPKAAREHAPTRPLDAVARLLGSLMPMIPEAERAKVWEALRSELHWSENVVRKVQKTVEDVLPLLTTTTPRGVSMPAMKVRIVHATTTVPATPSEVEAEPMAVNG